MNYLQYINYQKMLRFINKRKINHRKIVHINNRRIPQKIVRIIRNIPKKPIAKKPIPKKPIPKKPIQIPKKYIIPKKLIRSKNNNRKIPRIIHQTFKTNLVPESMYNAIYSFIKLNPNYDYYFYDDNDIEKVLNNFDCTQFSFTKSDLMKAYNKMNTGAGKADLFRYVILYKEGGCYFDIDTTCNAPLDKFIMDDDDIVSGVGDRGDLHQWGMIYSKNHPFIKKTIENCVYNIINKSFIKGYENSLEGVTGPPCLDVSIKQVLNLPISYVFNTGIYNINEFRFHILNGDCFNGNITFKYTNYLSDLKSINVEHWSHKPIFKD